MKINIPATSGVYKIVCQGTGMSYFGASRNMRQRVRAHARALTNGIHSNKAMQADFLKFGVESFSFEVAESVSEPGDLQERENALIEAASPGTCYNRKPSNMRKVSESERDMSLYQQFHTWRILFYARLAAMDSHILETLRGDLSIAVERIAGEIERRSKA